MTAGTLKLVGYQVDVNGGRGYATDCTQCWGFFRLPNSHCSSNSYAVAIMNQDGGLGVNGWHNTHDNMDIGRREWQGKMFTP